MSYFHYQPTDLEARKSGEDLTLSQFRAVRRLPDGRIGRAVAGDSLGILHNNPKIGQHATYQLHGICPAVAGAPFLRNAFLTTDAAARLIPAVAGGAYQYRADQDASAANDIVAVRREVGRA